MNEAKKAVALCLTFSTVVFLMNVQIFLVLFAFVGHVSWWIVKRYLSLQISALIYAFAVRSNNKKNHFYGRSFWLWCTEKTTQELYMSPSHRQNATKTDDQQILFHRGWNNNSDIFYPGSTITTAISGHRNIVRMQGCGEDTQSHGPLFGTIWRESVIGSASRYRCDLANIFSFAVSVRDILHGKWYEKLLIE